MHISMLLLQGSPTTKVTTFVLVVRQVRYLSGRAHLGIHRELTA